MECHYPPPGNGNSSKRVWTRNIASSPYHCELNPIELTWAAEQNYVAGENKNMSLSGVSLFSGETVQEKEERVA